MRSMELWKVKGAIRTTYNHIETTLLVALDHHEAMELAEEALLQTWGAGAKCVEITSLERIEEFVKVAPPTPPETVTFHNSSGDIVEGDLP